MNPESWWHLTRASGLMAWALLTASVLWGLLLSTRIAGRSLSPRGLADLHRWLSGMALAFVAVHLVSIYIDSFERFTLPELLVPMLSDWRPGAVAWGVLALYLLLAIEMTSLLMRRLSRRVWHRVHLTSFGLFALVTLHLVQAGTDRTNPVVMWSVIVVVSAITFLTLYGFITRRIPLDQDENSSRLASLGVGEP